MRSATDKYNEIDSECTAQQRTRAIASRAPEAGDRDEYTRPGLWSTKTSTGKPELRTNLRVHSIKQHLNTLRMPVQISPESDEILLLASAHLTFIHPSRTLKPPCPLCERWSRYFCVFFQKRSSSVDTVKPPAAILLSQQPASHPAQHS